MLGIKFSDLLTLNAWFNINPGPLGDQLLTILTWFFIIVIVIGFGFRVLAKRQRGKIQAKVWRRFGKLGLTMGILGFVVLFFFYEGVPFLSARFWLLVWFIGLIAWKVYILIYLFRKIPQESRENKDKQNFEKYLPR